MCYITTKTIKNLSLKNHMELEWNMLYVLSDRKIHSLQSWRKSTHLNAVEKNEILLNSESRNHPTPKKHKNQNKQKYKTRIEKCFREESWHSRPIRRIARSPHFLGLSLRRLCAPHSCSIQSTWGRGLSWFRRMGVLSLHARKEVPQVS